MKNSGSDWVDDGVTALADTCQYLTEIRGFEVFEG